jgi:hypothetical protein
MRIADNGGSLVLRVILHTLLLAVFFVSSNAGTYAGEPLLSGYVLRQHHEILGDTVTTICKDRVKVVVLRTAETLVCTAPLWRVSLYSLKSRRICTKNFDSFNTPFSKALFILGGTFMRGIPIVFSKTAVDHGIQISCYKAAPGFAETQMRRKNDGEVVTGSAKSIDYAVITDPTVPHEPHIAKTLANFLGLPPGSGVPLWLDYQICEKRHHTYTYMQLNSLVKGNFSASEFSIPKGLTQTAYPEQVMAGSEADDSVKLIIMGSEKTGKQPQKKR